MKKSEEQAISETVEASSCTPVSGGMRKAISDNVRPDYTCYRLRVRPNRETKSPKTVAVVIEAKLTTNPSITKVEPQVSLFVGLLLTCYCVTCADMAANSYSIKSIGYFISLTNILEWKPPVVIIITEEWVQVLSFPFFADQGRCVFIL